MNLILATLSRLLEPAERECICGDAEELRFSAPAAVSNILGLWIRRQLAEWLCWGPWVGLLGVVALAGYSLSGSVARLEATIFLQIRTYFHYGVAFEPGGVSTTQEVTRAATAVLAMVFWSWACGFVLAALSGRALWITLFAFYCVVRDGWLVRLVVSGNIIAKHGLLAAALSRLLPLQPIAIAFLLALTVGVRSARKATLQRRTHLYLPVVGLTFVFLLVWMDGWFAAGFAHWSGQPYRPAPFADRTLPWLAVAWPVLSIPLLQRERLTILLGKDSTL